MARARPTQITSVISPHAHMAAQLAAYKALKITPPTVLETLFF
jgi:hypothetical protein